MLQIKILNLSDSLHVAKIQEKAKLVWSVLAYLCLFNYWCKNKQTFSVQYKKKDKFHIFIIWKYIILMKIYCSINCWCFWCPLAPLHFVDCFLMNLFPFCNNEPVSFIYLFTVQEKAEGWVWESNILKWCKFNKRQSRAEIWNSICIYIPLSGHLYSGHVGQCWYKLLVEKGSWTEVAALSWEIMCIW